ncbi:MAG: DnaJ domain-containing protein [Candidatus Yanofskybacteria bacterium]|nr:DnaJ domain-containing protein [Candidatus Yanofskybacteria bacterium]
MAKDYYTILGIPRTASEEEIKKAYRKLAHQYHPDKKGGDEAKFKEVNEAYQVLSDPKKKSSYDNFGFAYNEGGFGNGQGFGGQGFDYSDIFGGMGGQGGMEDIFDMFSGMFGGGSQRSYEREENQRGENLYLEVNIKKSDLGTQKTIEFQAMDLCKECGGNGIERGYSMATCEICKGAGQVRQTSKSAFGYFTRVGICHKCGGKGRFPEKKCHKCSGDGRVKARRKLDILVPESVDGDYNIVVPKGGNVSRSGQAGDLVVRLKIR